MDQAKIMLERLNFIMASLNGHSAFKYTEHNREEAEHDKHKRVWELWKHEKEEPTIKEILEKMRAE